MSKKKYIEPPEKLWEYFIEGYVVSEKENAVEKTMFAGKDGSKRTYKNYPSVTFEGFETWLAMQGIINDLGDYSKNKDGRYTEYAPIITRIRKYCFSHNFRGASANELNPNLIARYHSITEKTENKNTEDIKISFED